MAQDTVDFADKDNTQPTSDPRRLVRDVDLNELKSVINANGSDVTSQLSGKQATLVSGTNIKTINSATLLGSGNISLPTAATVDAKVEDNLTASATVAPSKNAVNTALALKTAATNFAKGISVVGTLNGSNTVFTIAQTIVAGSEDVFLNGLRLADGIGYTMTYPGGVATITFAVAPATDDLIRVNYIRP